MMALSVNVPTEIFESAKDDIDLEDGEIEDDEEEAVKTPAPVPVAEKVVVPPKKAPAPKLEPPIIEASAVDSAKLLVSKNKDVKVKETKIKEPKVKESKKHSKKHSSKSSKQSQKLVEPSKPKHSVEVEDDWADNVERAIRAAMGKDPSAAVEPKSTREETLHPAAIPEFGTEEDRIADLSGDDKKSRKKKRKKKHRDEDGDERKESKRRKKHHHKEEMDEGLEGEDDDEMLFVRGASPINVYHSEKRLESQSPPVYRDGPYLYADDVTGQFDELYDSYEDDSDLEEYLHEIEGGPRRGRGIKRRGRGAIRGMLRKGLIRPRDLLALKKRKRLLLQRHPEQRPDSVCMFFMQGKCQKGDDCPYSHDALPPRKMELCKFYLMDCCAKKDKCLYMHHDFPCKFHHTGLKCYAGDRCKFSHGPLNDVLKNILLRHLETAPKEILGDFPRLSREGAAAMVHNKKSRDHTSTSPSAAPSASSRLIPSLFDIEVPVPAQFMPETEGEGGTSPARKTTPMPSDNEDQDVNNEHSPTSKESHSPNKRHKNRWDDSEETNDKPSRHDQNKQHWDEEIRKHQVDDGEDSRWNAEGKKRNDTDSRWNNERKRRDDGDGHWNESNQRDGGDNRWNNERKQRDDGDNRWNSERKQRDDGDNRWNNESKKRNDGDNRWNNENRRNDGEDHWNKNEQRNDGDNRWSNESKQREDGDNHWNNENKHDDGEKKKRRGDKEKRPRWDDGEDGHSRRRDVPREEDKRKWESDERRSKKRGLKDKGERFGDSDGYGEDMDHMKSTRNYKEEVGSQNQRLLKLAGYSSPHRSAPKPLDLDTDAEDKDDLVMDIDDHDPTGRKESVDEAALVIDTREDESRQQAGDNTGESNDAPVIPLHIQKLPKKQQELFLRIQQQQREQQNNQGESALEEKEEDRQEESWYSSDDDEMEGTSLSDVLKKLSASKVSQPDPDLAKKVTDLTRVPDVSDAVNKLLSSIGMRTQPENKTEKPKSSSTLPVLPLPPLPLPQPSLGPRDPRLSRDPRNRQGSSETRTSQDSPTPGSSSSSSSRVDPRARRRSSVSRSIYDSISLSGPDKPSDPAVAGRSSDTDIRGFPSTPREMDLRPSNKDLDFRMGYGELDFRGALDQRGGLLSTKPDSNTDLRRMLGGLPFKPIPQHTAATEIDASLNSHPLMPYKVSVVSIPTPDYSRLKVSSTDQLVRVDPRLRKLFKISSSSPASPPPLATPALVSPTPSGTGSIPPTRADPRRLASQSRSTVPAPDSQEAIQPDVNCHQRNANEMMNSDPFAMQNNTLLNQQGQFVRNELMANPMLLQQILPTMGLQNPQGIHPMQNIDPRMFRNSPQTPGLLGDAPYYPNIPQYDDMDRDNGNGSDNEQRPYYHGNKRMGNTMEMQEWEQQQIMEDQHRSFRNNRGNWRGPPRRMTNTRYQYDKRNLTRSNRSYTPPQM